MSKKHKEYSRTHHDFLLSQFFKPPHEYSVFVLKDFVLVRQYNKDQDNWQVAIWRASEYKKYQLDRVKRKAGLQPSLLVGKE